jgi:predicted nuclease of predicted toxin-antitoxin system
MKILIDMNLSPEWVSTFVTAGIESIHWSTVGDQAAPDRIIMEYAKVNENP